MDSQHHRKPIPSGHESHGVHLCHKCGWPFPNPHPSAKHRRAHKRICGTIEGYKLIDSGEDAHSVVSDDEQGSDEDRRMPSPKIVKRSTDEIESGGFGGRSNRSEDEVFSDAVTDFSDSGFGPAQEERLVGAIVSDKNEANVEVVDPCTSQQLKVDVTAGIQIPDIPTDSIQLHNPKDFETETNLLRSTMPVKDIVLSCNPDSVVNYNNRTEEFAAGGVGSVTCSTDDLSAIKSDVGDHEIQSSTMFVGQGSDVNENVERFIDEVLCDVAVTPSKTASEGSNMAFELQEMDLKTSDALSVEKFVEPKKDEGYESGPMLSLHDLSPEDKSCDHLEVLVNAAQIESCSAQARDVGSNSDSVEYTKEERNPNVYVLSVAYDIPVVDQPEVMIQDFKDHKYWIRNLSGTLDSGEVIEPVVDCNKGTVDEENPSNFNSVKSGEGVGTHISSAELHALEGNIKQDDGGDMVLVAEMPVEKEADTSELKVNIVDLGLNDVESPPETSYNGIQIPDIPTDSIQLHNPKDFETETNLLRSTMPVKDIVLSCNPDSVVNSNNRTEEFAAGGVGSVTCSTDDLSAIKSDVGDHEIQSSTMFVGQESDVNENEERLLDEVLSDVAVKPSKTASEGSNMAFELQEMDLKTSDALSVVQFVEPKKDEGYESGPMPSRHDLSPEDKSCDHLEVLVNAAQIESCSAQARDVGSNSDSVEYTKEERNPNIYVLSVANDIPVVDQPEVMIQDFKDHKYWIRNLSGNLDSGEVIEPVVDCNKGTVDEENPSNFNSVKSGEGARTHISSAELHALEGNIKQDDGGDRVLVAEMPVKKEADSTELKVNIVDLGLNDVEAPPETTASGQIQTDPRTKGQKHDNFHTDSSQNIVQESATMGLSSTSDEISHEADFGGGNSAFNREEDIIKKCDTDGQGSRELAREELPTIIKTTCVSVDNLFVSKTDQAVNLLGAGNSGGNEKSGIEFSDLVGNQSRDVAVQEKPEMNSKITIEMACGLFESKNIFDDAMSTDMKNLQEAEIDSNEVSPDARNLGITSPSHSSLQNRKDKDSHETMKEPKLDSMNEVLAESVRTACEGDESNHNSCTEVLKKIAQIATQHIPLESDLTMKSSATVDDSHCRDGGLGASGIITDNVEVEGHENLSKQPIEVLAVDASVDSCSRSDSLEGNWGSVSVISTQSDSLAAIDAAEALPAAVSEAPAQSKKVNLQKPKTASEGHHSNKLDVFEAPSFMTWVEPGDRVDQKAAASDFEMMQNTEQQKSEALQAGWFPSVTNIVNESQGRKKNEEIIAKVTNWSTTKQHTPLKSLLGDANLETKSKSPNPKQTPTVTKKDENTAKDNTASAPTTVNSILGQEPPPDQYAEKEVGKEWNSPARYPSDDKKEKRKVKGRPYWVPFVCCSSVN